MGNAKITSDKICGGIVSMNDSMRLLRYNTGTDKKAFIEMKEHFDAVIFNSTIVAYSGSAVADLVSVHKNRYIIDPQTHIFQHETTAIKSKNKKTDVWEVKKSIEKYLIEMPEELKNILLYEDRPVAFTEVLSCKDKLAEKVYQFQTQFINKFIEKKEYNKYLDFVDAGPKPRLVIAPYFMIKNEYSDAEMKGWMTTNKQLLLAFNNKNVNGYDISAQLVLDKKVLVNDQLIEMIYDTYDGDCCKYVFIWIDNFNSFSANKKERLAFYNLLEAFRKLGKKPIMAYGGYDSIFMCHKEITNKLYGVAQSVGYGEAREITPVGGGLPVNKYYFLPIHQRLNFREAADILTQNGYFTKDKTPHEHANDYYKYICDCKECHSIIGNDINNFEKYNESTPFTFKSGIKRNVPTIDASLIAAKHFLWCKKFEWDSVYNESLQEIMNKLLLDVEKYSSNSLYYSIKDWCETYAK